MSLNFDGTKRGSGLLCANNWPKKNVFLKKTSGNITAHHMRLFSTDPKKAGLASHVHEYTLEDLPKLERDSGYHFFLILTPDEVQQHKDELKDKLSDYWVGDTDLVDCMLEGGAPEVQRDWTHMSFALPSIAKNYEEVTTHVYFAHKHKSRMVVCTDLLDELVQVHSKWWEQGWAIGTIYQQHFQQSLLDYCDVLCKQLSEWNPRDLTDAREKKRIVSRFKTRWAELASGTFLIREDHKRMHADISQKILVLEEGAQSELEYFASEEPPASPPPTQKEKIKKWSKERGVAVGNDLVETLLKWSIGLLIIGVLSWFGFQYREPILSFLGL